MWWNLGSWRGAPAKVYWQQRPCSGMQVISFLALHVASLCSRLTRNIVVLLRSRFQAQSRYLGTALNRKSFLCAKKWSWHRLIKVFTHIFQTLWMSTRQYAPRILTQVSELLIVTLSWLLNAAVFAFSVNEGMCSKSELLAAFNECGGVIEYRVVPFADDPYDKVKLSVACR